MERDRIKETKHTIIIPTDFSHCADNAVQYAIGLAETISATAVFHHSCKAHALNYDSVTEEAEDAEVLNTVVKKLNQYSKNKMIDSGNIPFAEELSFGTAISDIVNLAVHKNADLIIMGAKGSSNIEDYLFGNTALAVIEKSPCPVMLIPDGVKFEGFSKIVYPTIYNVNDLENILKLIPFAQIFNAEIIIVHISETGFTDLLERETFNIFKDEVLEQSNYDKLKFQLQAGLNVGDVLNAVVNDEKADLLAMSVRQTNAIAKLFRSSVTKKVLSLAKIPVLTYCNNQQ